MNFRFYKSSIPLTVLLFGLTLLVNSAFTQTIDEMDRRASEYYKNREFTKALGAWLRILEIDPKNDKVQKKIEILYEEKLRKDLALIKAKYHYKLAVNALAENVEEANKNSEIAIASYIAAYRIDPRDTELQLMKEEMRKLQEEVKIELAKRRLSEELRKKYVEMMDKANTLMKEKKFPGAVRTYEKVLKLLPGDLAALEGLRNAKLAIENRIKFERIQALLIAAIALFNEEKYNESRGEFEQVVSLDSDNRQARSYLKKIDAIFEDQRTLEMKRLQAERFYISGIDNLRRKDFDSAEDDFENVLSLIDNYKDARARLESIDRLRKEWQEEQRLARLRTIDREFQRGLFAYSDARYKEALAHFEKTLSMDPKNDLAKKYIDRVKDAIRDLEEEVVDEDSPYFDLVNSLIISGKRLYQYGDYAGSREQWEKILRLFPKNRIALEFLLKCEFKINPQRFQQFVKEIIKDGKGFLRKRKHRDALKKFELVKSISPDYPGLAALIKTAEGGIKKAKVAEGADPGEIERRYRAGLALYQRGGEKNIKAALAQFQWIVARDPNNVKSLININKIKSQLRIGTADVRRGARRLSEKQKQLVRTYYYRGINYYTNNNFERAIMEWRKVLAIDPTNERARNNIRKSLVLLGR